MLEQWLNNPAQLLLIAAAIIVLILIGVRYRGRIGTGSLSNQLLLAFVGVAAVSLALVVGAVIWQTQSILTTQTGEAFAALAQSNSQRLEEGLVREIELLQSLSKQETFFYRIFGAGSVLLDDLPAAERQTLLETREKNWNNLEGEAVRSQIRANPVSSDLNGFIRDFPAHKQIIFVNQYGALEGVGGDFPAHYHFANEEWWQQAWNNGEGRIYLGNLRIVPGRTEATIDMAVPIRQPGSETVRGVLRSRFEIANLSALTDAPSLGETGEFMLVNRDGAIIYSLSQNQIGTRIPEAIVTDIRQVPVAWSVDSNQAGSSVIHSHAGLVPAENHNYLDGLGWTLIVQQPATEALSTVGQISQLVIVVGLLALIVAVVVGVVIARRITRPIEELTHTASTITEGELEQTAKLSGPTEIRTLAQAFNSMTEQLKQTLTSLENRVAARTQRLELVATLGERLSAILDLDELLKEVVTQVNEKFHYYHAHIYLVDENGQRLVVAAGTGQAGEEMLARGHNIPLNATTSLVARAARSGEIVRVDNVRESPDWLPNPLLPDTYAEMAVPIILEGKVVGVLDVQDSQIAGLDEADANLLRSLANQVAVTMRNAQLFDQVQTRLAEAREFQQRYVKQSWDKDQIARHGLKRIQFSLGESTTLDEATVAQARRQAFSHKEPTKITLNGQRADDHGLLHQEGGAENERSNAEQQALVAPILLHDVPIGSLQLHHLDPNREWAEGELALITAVIDQVAQSAENLRLIDEAQERAGREQLIGQISDKLRRAPDVETLMKIGVEELAKILRPARTFVHFGNTKEFDEQLKKPDETTIQSNPPSLSAKAEEHNPQNGDGDEHYE